MVPLGAMMIRLTVTIGFALTSSILAGCSNRHVIDLAELREHRLAARDDLSEPRKPSPPQQGMVSPPGISTGDPATTATIGRTREIRPWPKVGTPEWHQLQAEEAERERRILEAVNSICRGC